MNKGANTVLYPVSDLAGAKAISARSWAPLRRATRPTTSGSKSLVSR